MNFKELENQFWQLKGKQSAGVLDEAAFRAEVAKLRTQDQKKNWWTINPVNGSWLTYQGSQWVPGKPPVNEPEPDLLPPPPPTSAGAARPRPRRKPAPRPEKPKAGDQVPTPPPPRPRPKKKPSPSLTREPSPKISPKPPVGASKEKQTKREPPQPPKAPEVPPQRPRPAEKKKKHCPECGAVVGFQDKFCGDCGHSLIVGQKVRKPSPEPARQRQPLESGQESQSVTKKKRLVVISWVIGGLIYVALSVALMLLQEDIYNKIFGKYGVYIADVLAAIIIFNFVLSRNGIKTKYKAGSTPGKDMIFLAIFGLIFTFLTQIVGVEISGLVGGFLIGLLNPEADSMFIIYWFFGLSYLLFVLSGIVLSYPGINLARKMLLNKKKQ